MIEEGTGVGEELTGNKQIPTTGEGFWTHDDNVACKKPQISKVMALWGILVDVRFEMGL